MNDKKPSYFLILDGITPVDILDENDSCRPYYPNDVCGGCGMCLLMQFYHWQMQDIEKHGYSDYSCKPLTRWWKFYDWAHYTLYRTPLYHLQNLWAGVCGKF